MMCFEGGGSSETDDPFWKLAERESERESVYLHNFIPIG